VRHRDALTIDGNHNSRVFVHSGNGTLRLRRVSATREGRNRDAFRRARAPL
jgi:hypothetical protein